MLVKLVGLAQIARFKEARFFSAKQPGPAGATNVVTDGVAEDRRTGQQDAKEDDVEVALGGQNAGGDEQGVARKKESDEESRLGEDDHREAGVPAPGDQGFDVPQAMKELEQLIHA